MSRPTNSNDTLDDDEDDIVTPAKGLSSDAYSQTVRRGPPTQAEKAARPPGGKLEGVKLEHPMRIGIVCPGCGRTVSPRIVRTYDTSRQVECTSCRRQYVVQYDTQGWPQSYRFIR
jgi:hypothetical protein